MLHHGGIDGHLLVQHGRVLVHLRCLVVLVEVLLAKAGGD